MNTIDSSNSATAIAEATGAEVNETVDSAAVEILKALVAIPGSTQSKGQGGGFSRDEEETDWAELNELALGMASMGGVPLPSLWIPDTDKSTPSTQAPSLVGVNPADSDELLALAAEAARSSAKLVSEASEKSIPAPSNDAPATLGASILESLYRQAPPTTAKVDQAPRIEELMQGLVDRVLVTDPLSGQNKEVRIKFQENILPGTEVRVWREEGRVRVEFHTSVPESARWLEGALAGLSARLDERLSQHAPSLVTVNSTGDAPSDGRSRQRHNPWDLVHQDEAEDGPQA